MNNYRQLLGKRIRTLRKSRGLTQEELSELLEIDQKNLSKIECGNVFPSRVLSKLPEALQVPLSELFNFEIIELTDEERAMFIKENLENLSPESLDILYNIVKRCIY